MCNSTLEISPPPGKKKRERKKSPKPVTVEVQAHVEHAPEPEVIEEVAVVPVIGAFEGVRLKQLNI